MTNRAVVLLSGGLDSATALAVARDAGRECYALSFAYGQRHACELQAAAKIAAHLGVTAHRTVTLDLGQFGGSALTDSSLTVPTRAISGLSAAGSTIPLTYVPARNTIFLSIALAWAEVLVASEIYIGINAVDYSGYPDCRPEYLNAYQQMANLATRVGVEGGELKLCAPLLKLSKHEIISLGSRLGVNYALTISCYNPDSRGYACGQCEACQLRSKGFNEANICDPTHYQLQH
ncbi:MAG: 7-cyano-7-deazaguanine synthase QueC [Gammaproteobacteria bacterium]|nr:7-cyano-7-deazaguanine synthase QueC [Gammaproteobacteria bacterium]